MAHYCPECGQICFCCGDTDDIVIDDMESAALCEHCPTDDKDEPPETNEE